MQILKLFISPQVDVPDVVLRTPVSGSHATSISSA
jgi:hypothetical protein